MDRISFSVTNYIVMQTLVDFLSIEVEYHPHFVIYLFLFDFGYSNINLNFYTAFFLHSFCLSTGMSDESCNDCKISYFLLRNL